MSDLTEVADLLRRVVYLLEQQNRKIGARTKPPVPGRPVAAEDLVTVIRTGERVEPQGDEMGLDPLPAASTRLPRAWTRGDRV
jgi:hypothetical protein